MDGALRARLRVQLLACGPGNLLHRRKRVRRVLAVAGAAPIVLNAANEIAVGCFLDGRIGFADIASLVEQALGSSKAAAAASIEEVIALDAATRDAVGSMIEARCH